MIRALAVAGGLAGAGLASQYPSFTEDYTQRLAGQVDALSQVVADFDASALRAGLTRDQALAQMTGTAFLDDRRTDMQRSFLRHAVLADNLAQLRAASPAARLTMPHRLGDMETLRRTWGDFTPSISLTTAGLTAAVAGFALGWALLRALLALLSWPLQQRKNT